MILDRTFIGKIFAEYVGTFTLAGVVVVMSQTIGQPFLTGIAAALVLATFVTTVGGVSGAHLNPAVTIGMVTLRRTKIVDGLFYIIVQFLGAFSALALVEYMYATQVPSENFKGGFDGKIFLAELIGAAIFTFGIASVVSRRVEGYQASAAIGTSLFMGIMLASMGSSALINPAIAFSAGTLNINYIFGPLIGAVLAMNLQNLLTAPQEAVTAPARAASVRSKATTKKKSSRK